MAVDTKTKKSFLENLMQKIDEVYHEESIIIVDKHKKQINDELENLRDEIITRASMRIEEMVKISGFGSEITITILKDNRA